MDKLTIIVPCYNEHESIPFLIPALHDVMESMREEAVFEVIMVNNCSEDNTLELMKEIHEKDPRFQYISFSRNFGKDASMYAGLQAAAGDYVTIMDADLQDPPELIPEMYKALKSGEYDCAAAYREDRKGEPWLRSVLAKGFYRLMGSLSKESMRSGARDFRLMTRQMVNAVLEMDESVRFTKGIFAWVGFRTVWIPFHNRERVAGKTKLPMSSAFRYAMRGITAFSTVPLLISSIIGILFCLAAVVYAVVTIVKQLITHEASPGYPSLMVVILLGFGLILLMLGIIGQYLSQMYLEIKHRPKYIIKETSLSEAPED